MKKTQQAQPESTSVVRYDFPSREAVIHPAHGAKPDMRAILGSSSVSPQDYSMGDCQLCPDQQSLSCKVMLLDPIFLLQVPKGAKLSVDRWICTYQTDREKAGLHYRY